ncbi:MAG: tetratricopeptide repeat-containing sensor histidine kinase [Bacteroidetes bacterium]|nr:tetratricopeptide repeat-containing sensor histidine kinase [Bacteroidota bacterium]
MKFFCVVAWLLLLSLATPYLSLAQSREIARLHTQLRVLRERKDFVADTAYVDTLNRLAHAFYGIQADSAFLYGRKAVEYASITGYARGESEAWRMLGNTYEMRGDYTNMLSSYHHSLDIAERIGDIRLIAKANSNIALFFKQEGEYDEAEKLMEKVSDIYKQSGDSTQSAAVFSHLSDLALRRRDFAAALKYAHRALDEARALGDGPSIANYNITLGKVLAAKGDYAAAVSSYMYSLAYYRDGKQQKMGVMTASCLLAQAYLAQKDYTLALHYATMSLAVAHELRRKPEIQGAAKVLADIYEAKGDDRTALSYFKLYKDYSDSLFNDQSSKQVLAMAARYDFEKREMRLRADAAQRDASYQRRLRKDSLQISITVFVIAILMGLAFILWRSRLVNRKVNQLLREKNEKIEEQKETLEHQAVQLLLNNQEKDKLFSIVAHDLRGPLNSLKDLLDFLKEKKLSEAEINSMMLELRRNVDSSSELVANLLFWASSQLDGIVARPVVLPMQALIGDTLALFSHQAAEKGVTLRAEVSPALEGYADKDMIQMVVRNLVSNAVKFCRSGDSITVCASRKAGEIEIKVIDTGIGMKEDALERIRRRESFTSYGTAKEKGTGLGMLLCQDFTVANKGRFRVESEWGKGSCCYFTIPTAPISSSISV